MIADQLDVFISRECAVPTRHQTHLVDVAASSFETTTAMLNALALWQEKDGDTVGALLIREFITKFGAHEKDNT